MVFVPPRPADSDAPARWLSSRIDPWAEHWVTGMVGAGFAAYARMPHPRGDDDDGPRVGSLAPAALAPLCALLAGHTSTPETCWFAVWDGWGWQHPGAHRVTRATTGPGPLPPIEFAEPERQLDLSAPRFCLPGRDYLLYSGPVSAATDVGHWVTADWFDPQSPSMFWPEDHAWCVATEIDCDLTLVGGTIDLVDAVIRSIDLVATVIRPDAPRSELPDPWDK